MKTAEEMFEEVKSMDNDEHWRFLLLMYNEYFRKGEPIEELDIDWD